MRLYGKKERKEKKKKSLTEIRTTIGMFIQEKFSIE